MCAETFGDTDGEDTASHTSVNVSEQQVDKVKTLMRAVTLTEQDNNNFMFHANE
jgi:hypothetical protein